MHEYLEGLREVPSYSDILADFQDILLADTYVCVNVCCVLLCVCVCVSGCLSVSVGRLSVSSLTGVSSIGFSSLRLMFSLLR